MQCHYFDAGQCRSCTLMGVPYADQLAAKDARVRALIEAVTGPLGPEVWQPPQPSPESAFRTKSAMVVGGTPPEPTLGILGPDGQGVDLTGCGLLAPASAAAMPLLREFIATAGLRPYDVPRRTGELKYVHLIEGDDGSLMVRFVLRSEGQLGRLRRSLPLLVQMIPGVRVVSANLLPEHKAVTEGGTEILLSEAGSLPMTVGDVRLFAHPGAFVQTNTQVAGALYRQAAQWVGRPRPHSVLDLYCGIGGFALHAARAMAIPDDAAADDAETADSVPVPADSASVGTVQTPRVLGVEISEPAVISARRAAEGLRDGGRRTESIHDDGGTRLHTHSPVPQTGRAQVSFEVADARVSTLPGAPDLVIVNPPRRGLGPELTARLNDAAAPVYASTSTGTVGTVIYSSCNPATLAKDLAAMPNYELVRARLFDMFPQSDHAEVLTLLRRR